MYEQDYIKIIREIIQNKLFRIYIFKYLILVVVILLYNVICLVKMVLLSAYMVFLIV